MHVPVWLWFALGALLSWGISGVIQKLSTNEISTELAVLWFCFAMFVLTAVFVLAQPIAWHVTAGVFGIAAFSGLLNVLGVLTSFAALESGGKASIVIPLTCLYPLVTIFIAVIFFHETLTHLQLAGVALAIVAAVLLSRELPPAEIKGAE